MKLKIDYRYYIGSLTHSKTTFTDTSIPMNREKRERNISDDEICGFTDWKIVKFSGILEEKQCFQTKYLGFQIFLFYFIGFFYRYFKDCFIILFLNLVNNSEFYFFMYWFGPRQPGPDVYWLIYIYSCCCCTANFFMSAHDFLKRK